MRRITLLAAAMCFAQVIASTGSAHAQNRKPKQATVGIVIDGPWHQNDNIVSLVQREIVALTRGDFDVRLPESKRIIADWTQAGVRDGVDRLLADPEVDIVITLGVLASNDAANREVLPKPVLAPFIIDAELQGLPRSGASSGRKNLNYLTASFALARDLEVFREIVPVTRVAILVNPNFAVAVPGIRDRMRKIAKKSGVDLTIVPVTSKVNAALKQIPDSVDGVYVGPLLHLSEKQFKQIVRTLIRRRLPSFSFMGRPEVEAGLLAGIRPFSDWSRVARRLAISVQRIMLGDDPKEFPVVVQEGEELVINLDTARKIGIWPPWSVLTEAEVVGEGQRAARHTLTLDRAMRLARQRNLDVQAAKRTLATGEALVKRARSRLFPQIELSSQARLIDADRAEASFGAAPERQWTGDATATQLIWSDAAWAGLTVEQHLQDGRESAFREIVLDATLLAAESYLNVLRALSFERIRRQNLAVTRENLELARSRVRAGNVSRADVLRWESQIARDRTAVIDASAQRNIAEIALNQSLGLPVEEPVRVKPTSLRDPKLMVSDRRFQRYLKDPQTFRWFRLFLLEEAARKSPELAQLDAAIRAQERSTVASRRALWAPTVALRGGVTHEFADGGVGSGNAAIPPLPGGVMLPQQDETNWFVGINLSFPLVEGGGKWREVDRASAELERLRLSRKAALLRIEQRVASALHQAGSAFAAIGLSRQAASAARENLKLVRDAYGNGTVSIQQLLDAQNASLIADLQAANAVYNFLIDYMRVQRASGGFGLFLSEAERADFFERAGAHARQSAKETE